MDRAVAAARAAFNKKSEWRTMDASRRGELMVKVYIFVCHILNTSVFQSITVALK